MAKLKKGETQHRWQNAIKYKVFAPDSSPACLGNSAGKLFATARFGPHSGALEHALDLVQCLIEF